jgi:YggT family protein
VNALPLAIGRADIADYLDTLITVYIVLILIQIIVSWFRSIPYHPVLSAFLTFVNDVTRPYLNLFRRIIPMARVGPAAIDLSPMVAVFVLGIVGGIATSLIRG